MTKSFLRQIATCLSVFIISILCSKSFAQQSNVYADTETHDATTLSSVTNAASAVDGNLQTNSSLNVVVLGAAWQQFAFTGASQPSSTSTVHVKMSTTVPLVTLLSGASIQAYSGSTAVGTPQLLGDLITVLNGVAQYEIAFKPNVAFNAVRISFGGINLGGSLNLFEVYFTKAATNVDCDAAIDELHGVISLGILSFLGSVANPLSAIDGDANTYSTINSSVGLLAYTQQTVIYPGPSVPGDSVRLIISTPTALIPLDLLNSIAVVTYNDNTFNNDAIANRALLSIRPYGSSTTKAIISFVPGNVFNRVELRLGGLLSVLSYVNLYEAQRIEKAPTPLVGYDTTVCSGTAVALTANTAATRQVQWYNAASGGTLLGTGNTFTTPSLNNTTIYYLSAMRTGCSNTSARISDTVYTVGISSVTPGARCGAGVVSMTVASTPQTITWYNAGTGGSAVSTGNTFSPSLSATTNYYVASGAPQCALAARTLVTGTVNAFTWAGTNSTDWSTLANWDCGSTPPSQIPTSSQNVTIPTTPTGGRFPTVFVTAPVKDITISTGASVTVASGGTFEIYGAINNSGTFTSTSGTISMRGTASQNIPANAFYTNTIYNLTINNTSGVSIGGALNLTGTLQPSAGILSTNGYLTLKSTASGTARIAQGTAPYITGSVNVERYMPARRSWRLMTAPLSNTNTIYESWQNNGVYAAGKGMLVTAPGGGVGIDSSGNSSLKKWNITNQVFEAIYNTKVSISPSSTGAADNMGYMVFVRGDRDPNNIDHNLIKKNITTLTTTGYVQSSTQNFALCTTAGGGSLIGNPYACPIDMNLVFANTGTTNLKRKFYVWDPNLNSVGGYAAMDDVLTPGTFQPSPSTSTQGNYIQSSQAFFVLTNTAGSAALEIKESNKNGGNSTVIFGKPMGTTESFITNLYLLDTTNNSTVAVDGVRADFNNAFSAEVDDYDNIKFGNVNETFGMMRNNIFLATERRPYIDDNKDTLYFRLLRSTKRTYQFQFTPSNFPNPEMIVKLEDSYTGIATVLSATEITKVNFVINADSASQAKDRFRVVFNEATPLAAALTVKAYRKDQHVNIEWKVENEINIAKYEVEKSADGVSFSKINTLFAKGANSSTFTYACIDEKVSDHDVFYRIKSIALNGKIKYSPIVNVQGESTVSAISVYPNPVVGKIMNVHFNNQPEGVYTLNLISTTGELIMNTSVNHTGATETKSIFLPGTIATGNYRLMVYDKNLKESSVKLMIQ